MAKVTLSDTVALTQNVWTKIRGFNGNRTGFNTQNIHATAAVAVSRLENPWCVSFDGTDDTVAISDYRVLTDDIGTIITDKDGVPLTDITGTGFYATMYDDTAGSIKAEVLVDAVEDSAVRTIFSIADTSAVTCLELYINTQGYPAARLVKAGVTHWEIRSLIKMEASTWYTIKLVHNGTTPKIHVNGDQSLTTAITSTTLASWLSELSTALDNAYIGALSYNAAGAAQFYQGDINFVEVFSGITGASTKRVKIAEWDFTEGSGIYSIDTVDGWVANFKGSGEPAWASYENGYQIDAGSSARDVMGEDDSRLWAWGLTATASVSVIYSETLTRNPGHDF